MKTTTIPEPTTTQAPSASAPLTLSAAPCVLERIAAGDPSAVDDLYERYGRLVWWLVLRGTHSQSDAEDATQEIFVQLWRHAGRFDPSRGSEATFIGLLTRRWLSDHRRKQSRELRAIAEIKQAALAANTDTHDVHWLDESSQSAADMLTVLKDDHRQVLWLAIVQGLSMRSIAKRMDLPVGTVRTIAQRAITRLRQSAPHHLTLSE